LQNYSGHIPADDQCFVMRRVPQQADRTAVISFTLCDAIAKCPKRALQVSMHKKRELAFSSDLLAITVAWTLGSWKALSEAVGPTAPMISKYVNEQTRQPHADRAAANRVRPFCDHRDTVGTPK
jgi:hypothetical protein